MFIQLTTERKLSIVTSRGTTVLSTVYLHLPKADYMDKLKYITAN